MTTFAIRDAGDSALLLEFEPVISPSVNAMARGVAATLMQRQLAGVRDVVPTFRSVAVHFDPLAADVDAIRDALGSAVERPLAERAAAPVEIPVMYGGADGPDLEAVAAFAGVSEAEVIARHSRADYRVYMLGFLPGFAYMGPVDSAIAMPRRSSPRLNVPAGSVGIAGAQTGVYPFASPGGWQIIGRTSATMFDPGRTPPSLLAPGDRVRFVPVSSAPSLAEPSSRSAKHVAEPSFSSVKHVAEPSFSSVKHARHVTVLKPGLFTTVQDEGRWGCQQLGVPVSGAMDLRSHRLANALVGNDASAATLEVTIAGPELRMESDTVVAITGADLGAALDGTSVPVDAPLACQAGALLRFGTRRSGGRAYVSFGGGIAVPPTLGSRSTHVRTRMGGIGGRALRSGDLLPLGSPRQPAGSVAAEPGAVGGGARLRVMSGPQDGFFPAGALDVVLETRFTVVSDSDRMGYRLTGDRRIPPPVHEMISDATFAGALQVPASGQPILLMADRQTTGGYPQIAVVITADLPLAGQLVPGDWVEFELCSRSQALAALVAR
ncbi:MAG TPA: 5-oxoprolinase subunit PxpB [Vicinamibacterales bacterium]|nr:5-oxoprolinase subunit PxpB [Vicinamibacterales bacterium]